MEETIEKKVVAATHSTWRMAIWPRHGRREKRELVVAAVGVESREGRVTNKREGREDERRMEEGGGETFDCDVKDLLRAPGSGRVKEKKGEGRWKGKDVPLYPPPPPFPFPFLFPRGRGKGEKRERVGEGGRPGNEDQWGIKNVRLYRERVQAKNGMREGERAGRRRLIMILIERVGGREKEELD